jgi:DNA-binding NarL/FixJ family response regulator
MEKPREKIGLFVIEDNANIIVPGLKNLFRHDRDRISVTGYAKNVEEAMEEADPSQFDLIILDLWIGSTQPLVNLQKVKSHFPGKPVIIYTQDTSPVWRRKMMAAGAKAYIIKDATREEMKQAFEEVAVGKTWVSGRFSDEEQDNLFRIIPAHSVRLSPAQRRMVDLLTLGMKREEIAEQMNLSSAAIDKTFAKLRTQFKVKTNYELVRHLIENGLL